MTRQLGSYNTSSTRTHVRFQFSTHAAAGGNVAPSTAFEAADLRIYRAADGAAFSATQRSSASGITMTSPFDTLTGVHDVDIDLGDNSDPNFYATGYRYSIMLAPDTETVDSQTITGIVLAEFEIGPPPVNVTQLGGVVQSLTDLKDFADTGYDPATHKVQGVVLTDTLTTYTGNTVQTGDCYAAVTSAVPDSIPADGSRPSVQQAAYMMVQTLTEGAISGTTWTIKKPDGSTTLFTVTLDSSTAPTSKTRAS